MIGGKSQKIEIRGHTARAPGTGDRWDLAYARCRKTMKLLTELGIGPQKSRE